MRESRTLAPTLEHHFFQADILATFLDHIFPLVEHPKLIFSPSLYPTPNAFDGIALLRIALEIPSSRSSPAR